VNVVTKAEAISNGYTRYYTGIPCKYGHICERITSDRGCVECKRVKTRAWLKQSRSTNYNGHGDKQKEYVRASKARRYLQSDFIRLGIIERVNLRKRVKADAIDKSDPITAIAVADLLSSQKGKCFYCSINIINRYTLDHFIPLSRGGKHSMSNIRLACQPCNDSKGSKIHPTEWVCRKW